MTALTTPTTEAAAGARDARAPQRSRVPTLREERRLLRDGAVLVAGVDEVGRGALAGPVTVGVVVVTETTRTAPSGLRDSKLLTPAAREALAPRLRRWATSWAVGHAEPDEIDAHGILPALRLAGTRALAQLPVVPDAVLLDGSYDWLTRPPVPLALFEPAHLQGTGCEDVELPPGAVRTLVKGDLRCAAVAAASVLAKTARDALMCERDATYPGYGWAGNKGYSAPEHLGALGTLGPCEQHRRSWRLPGLPGGREDVGADAPGLDAESLPTLFGDEGMMAP